MLLCRTRAASFSNMPANLQIPDIVTVWDTSGWKSMGMPLKEFLSWMLLLDGEFMAYARARAS